MEILRVQRTVVVQLAVANAFIVCVALARFDPVRVQKTTSAVWLIWLAVTSCEVAETIVSPFPLTLQLSTAAVAHESASVALSACQVSPSLPSSSKSGTRNSNRRAPGL